MVSEAQHRKLEKKKSQENITNTYYYKESNFTPLNFVDYSTAGFALSKV